MIEKMAKVQLVGYRAILPDVLDRIYRYGRLHIDKVTYPTLEVQSTTSFSLKEMSLSEEELKELTELESLYSRINEMIKYLEKVPGINQESLPVGNAGSKEMTEGGGFFAKKDIEQLRVAVNKIEEQKDAIQEDVAKMEDISSHVFGFGRILEAFAGLMEKTRDIGKLDFVGFTVEKDKKAAIDLIKGKLNEIMPNEYEIFTANMDRRTLASVIACSPDNAKKIRDMFSGEGIQELTLPDEFANRPLKSVVALLQERKSGLSETKKQIDSRLREFAAKNGGQLRKLRAEIGDRLAYFGEIPKFAETKFTFVMIAWLPAAEMAKFKEMLKQAYKNMVVVEELSIEETDKKGIPVTLKNNPLVRPFEAIIKVFKPPVYGSLDPTWILAAFFPLFFGMILGDIAYGLMMLLPVLWIWYKKGSNAAVRDLCYIFTLCAVSSIVFGFLFGEFLGNLGEPLFGLRSYLPNREKEMVASLVITAGLGFFHIVLSLTLRGIQAYKEHHSINKHVIEAVATIAVLFMILSLVLIMAKVLPRDMMTPSLIGLVVSLALVIFTGGMIGGLEIMGTVGNVLSYTRIMAIGLSSVILAAVANQMVGKLPILVLGIAVASLLHFINLALGIFGPTIHGLRLHFVESFQKFAKFEGKVYQPFKRGGEL